MDRTAKPAKCTHNWKKVDSNSQELYPTMWCTRCGTLRACHYVDMETGAPKWGYRRPGFKL